MKVLNWIFIICQLTDFCQKIHNYKSAILQSKESSNQKMQENKLALKFNFTLEYM